MGVHCLPAAAGKRPSISTLPRLCLGSYQQAQPFRAQLCLVGHNMVNEEETERGLGLGGAEQAFTTKAGQLSHRWCLWLPSCHAQRLLAALRPKPSPPHL